MQRVKFFKSIENELGNLEAEVNDWLETSGCRLVSLSGNIAPQTLRSEAVGMFPSSDVLIIAVYEDGHE